MDREIDFLGVFPYTRLREAFALVLWLKRRWVTPCNAYHESSPYKSFRISPESHRQSPVSKMETVCGVCAALTCSVRDGSLAEDVSLADFVVAS